MLLQFNFKNFKSFKNSATLDLTATKISEHEDHAVNFGNEKILPIAGIFGANAGGKSNVYEAFKYMSVYVIFSIRYGADSKREDDDFSPPMPFLFDSKSREENSEFEVYFTMGNDEEHGKLYNYGFAVNSDGVQEEWLNCKAKTSRGDYKTIFYRNGDELDLSGLPRDAQSNIKNGIEKKTLIVSLGAQIKVKLLKEVRAWFYRNTIVNFGDELENYFVSRSTPIGFAEDREVQKKVRDYLASFEPSIIDFIVEKTVDEENPKEKSFNIKAVHKMVDSDETYAIPLYSESSGTLKMFALYPYLDDVLNSGSVLFVDELNSRLHPLLVRMLVTVFFNKQINKRNAQLIFTSHDAWQLNNNSLRRDEIWFVEKDNNGISTLYSLADFVDENGDKIRRDENVEKNYLLGKYGAIPKLTFFDFSND